jgi:PPOX class probable F420-dependent enzyme
MTDVLDPARPEHEKALRLLETRTIAWFTWVGRDGAPHGVPVWFFWHDGQVIVLTEPDTAKVSAVRRGSPILVHLETGEFGSDVVILGGSAEISDRSSSEWLPDFREAYEQKYAAAIADYGTPLDDIAEKFSTTLVFTPARVLTW